VEAPGSYRIGEARLDALRAHVIEQALRSEAEVAERLLGQLASLHVCCQRQEVPGELTFRPTRATAGLAARAFAALEAAEPAAMPGAVP
jgi:hypothetical protein